METTSPSLLMRLRISSDAEAWRRFHDLYRPLLLHWVSRYHSTLRAEDDDLVQEVMDVVVREIARFQHQRTGSFRRWLCTILANRAKAHHRARQHRPQALGGALAESPL